MEAVPRQFQVHILLFASDEDSDTGGAKGADGFVQGPEGTLQNLLNMPVGGVAVHVLLSARHVS